MAAGMAVGTARASWVVDWAPRVAEAGVASGAASLARVASGAASLARVRYKRSNWNPNQ